MTENLAKDMTSLRPPDYKREGRKGVGSFLSPDYLLAKRKGLGKVCPSNNDFLQVQSHSSKPEVRKLSVKDQVVNILGFVGHMVLQQLNSTIVAKKQP